MLNRILYRSLGLSWMVSGLIIIILILLYILMGVALLDITPRLLGAPELIVPIIDYLLRLGNITARPTISTLAVGVFGAFCVVVGFGLLALQSWSRTIAGTMHAVLAGGIIGVALWLYAGLQSLPVLGMIIEGAAPFLLLGGAVLSLLSLFLCLKLNSADAMDAFVDARPSPRKRITAACPHCGNPLNIGEAKCDHCDVDLWEVPPRRARLVSLDDQRDYLIPIRDQTLIGRDNPKCTVLLADPSVSGEHASVEFVDGRFMLHALKDTNGTYVNDVKVRDMQIESNDQVAFGNARFRFEVEKA